MRKLLFAFLGLILFCLVLKYKNSNSSKSRRNDGSYFQVQNRSAVLVSSDDSLIPHVGSAGKDVGSASRAIENKFNEDENKANEDLNAGQEERVRQALDTFQPLDVRQVQMDIQMNPHATSHSLVVYSSQMARLMDLVDKENLSATAVRPIANFFSDCSRGREGFLGMTDSVKIVCLSNLRALSEKYQIYQEDLQSALSETSPRNRQIYEFLRPHQSRGT